MRLKLFDFDTDDPERLLGECEPEDLFHLVKVLGPWTERALAVSHSALAYWASEALVRPHDRKGIGEIRSLIRRLQAIQPLEKQAPELEVEKQYLRWNGMVDILDARIHMLDCNPPKV